MTPTFPDLRALIEFASEQVEKLFRRQGVIYPMYHAVRTDGRHMVISPPSTDKNLSVALIKAAFELHAIDHYVFCDEAWIVSTLQSHRTITPSEMARMQREGLSNHPDRNEVVMFSAENRRGEQITAQRIILRPEHGKAKLLPLDFVFDDLADVRSEGRMIGLLQTEKK
ncbi:MAG TPA: hypothetical protein VM867_08325 [Xanthobacteraceae bacterium]|nr:hypothetical protein [Xanthobacteraceae bacterium]